MNISKKILRVINEGVLNALSFDDELPDTLDITMHRISNDNAATYTAKLEKEYYSRKLQEMFPDHLADVHTNNLIKPITQAAEWYELYGATFRPHFEGSRYFSDFIALCIYVLGKRANLNWIDTSEITNMASAFRLKDFNGDISEWDVSNVTDMALMFDDSTFNGDLSKWDVSNVTDMGAMFAGAKFNNDSICHWDTSNVTDMKRLFEHSIFNYDLSSWDVSNVKDMSYMFEGAVFNKNISTWNTSNVETMTHMFAHSNFNGDLSKWDVSNVKTMTWMFFGDYAFNLPIGNWDVSNVENVEYMFANDEDKRLMQFNLDISNWNFSNIDYVGVYMMFLNCKCIKEYMPKQLLDAKRCIFKF